MEAGAVGKVVMVIQSLIRSNISGEVNRQSSVTCQEATIIIIIITIVIFTIIITIVIVIIIITVIVIIFVV